MSGISGILKLLRLVRRLPDTLEALQLAIGRIESRQLSMESASVLAAHEFKAFSQFGEDGILDYLTRNVPGIDKTFVEFGVSDYAESNTRFLLQNGNWAGLVLDGSAENIEFIKTQPYYWQHNLTAACSFIDRDNINATLRENRFDGSIGILSIDIDGNDYWVWQAIDCVNPAIVVCEYNSLFGSEHLLTVPYDAQFSRGRAHHSCLYFGASLGALAALGTSKGYALVGSNTAGNNAFFVRRDLLSTVPELSARQSYVRCQFREARDSAGQLSFLDFESGVRLIADLPLYDLEARRTVTLRQIGMCD